jgi:hypothetical protein
MVQATVTLFDLDSRSVSYRSIAADRRFTVGELMVSGGRFALSTPAAIVRVADRLGEGTPVYVGELVVSIDGGSPFRGVQVPSDTEVAQGDVVLLLGGTSQITVDYNESAEAAGQIEYMAEQLSDTIWKFYLRPEEISANSPLRLAAQRGPASLVLPLLARPHDVDLTQWATVEGLIDATCFEVFRAFSHPRGEIDPEALRQASQYLQSLASKGASLRVELSHGLDSGEVQFADESGHRHWFSITKGCIERCFSALDGYYDERVALAGLRYRLRGKEFSYRRPIVVG